MRELGKTGRITGGRILFKGRDLVTLADRELSKIRGSQIAMIYQGKIIWEGSPDTVDDSGNAFVDQFVHGRAHGPITDGIKAA